MSDKKHNLDWVETGIYGNSEDGQFVMYCNHTNGWAQAKSRGGEYSGLGFQYKHFDATNNGSTFVTLEEARDIHKKIGQYIDYMEESQ